MRINLISHVKMIVASISQKNGKDTKIAVKIQLAMIEQNKQRKTDVLCLPNYHSRMAKIEWKFQYFATQHFYDRYYQAKQLPAEDQTRYLFINL